MKFYRFAEHEKKSSANFAFRAHLLKLMAKERSAYQKRMLLRKYLFLLMATVFCGIDLSLICIKIFHFNEGVPEAVAFIILILLLLVSLFAFALLCIQIGKKLPYYGKSLPNKILIARCCEPLRAFYCFREPHLLTKCYACTNERWNNHDVCLFFYRGHICVTADIIHGYTHSYQDLGCYQFELTEFSLQYAKYNGKIVARLTADRFEMYLGKRAKPFICRNTHTAF